MYGNRILATYTLKDVCDIETWKPHNSPLGFFGHTTDSLPIAVFFWGEDGYNITTRVETVWGASLKGSGIGKIAPDAIQAVDSFSDGALVILEKSPEFAIEKWEIKTSAVFKYGTGGQGDNDDVFNNPKDVTVDNEDWVYVLDVLSNGQPRIKVFDNKLKPVKGFGDSSLIPGTPISIDWNDKSNALHVLHSQGVAVIYK